MYSKSSMGRFSTKSWMSAHHDFASMVESTLLSRTLFVIRLTHCVVVGPQYKRLSPPTVMRTCWVLLCWCWT